MAIMHITKFKYDEQGHVTKQLCQYCHALLVLHVHLHVHEINKISKHSQFIAIGILILFFRAEAITGSLTDKLSRQFRSP